MIDIMIEVMMIVGPVLVLVLYVYLIQSLWTLRPFRRPIGGEELDNE